MTAELLGGEGVADKVATEPTVLDRDADAEQARIAAAVAVVFAGLLGIFPPDYVAAVVAFAFGLAASSFFPAILMGIFWKRMNAPGAVAGMIVGITARAL